MGYWKFVVPEATTNLFTDPSFALADPDTEWTIAGDGTAPDVTRNTDYSFYSFGCAEMDIDDGTVTRLYQGYVSANESYTVSAMVRRRAGGVPTASHTRCEFDGGAVDWDSITSVGNGWYLCVYTATSGGAGPTFGIRAYETGLCVDGLQLENKDHHTTFCDGSRDGCYWNGGANTSTSSRSAMSRAGGRVYDFEDDYSFEIVDWMGWGVPPHLLNLDRYAILPGASINNIKTDVTQLTLTGYFQGSSLSNLHSLRQALVEELAHDRYPQTDEGWQPVRIWYTGAAVWKEARAYYDSGLEGSSMVGNAFTERIPVRFLMADPLWVEIGDSAVELDTYESDTMRYIAGRMIDRDGEWYDMGLTANPAANGTIYKILVASDRSVYIGGDFDGLNNDGAPADAGCDYVARYDPEDETWNVLVGASDVNGTVYDIIEAPDGIIYLCGAFTAVNGDGDRDYIVAYNPSDDTWSDVGTPDQGAAAITLARGMAFDSDGDLYVVGDFTNWADVAAADYIAKWDGTNWTAVGTPSVTAGYPYCIAIDIDDNIFIGGTFDNFAGDADADSWAWYNGTSWAAVNDISLQPDVRTMTFDDRGNLYVGGSILNAGGVAEADQVFMWNGSAVIPLGTAGTSDAPVWDLEVMPDGTVIAAGVFTSIGGLDLTRAVARWNGSVWTHLDIRLPVGPTVYAVAAGPADPVVPSNYDLYLGYDGTGTAFIAEPNTVTNGGTAAQYPIISVTNNDSTPTDAILYSIRNETTGKTLYCDYTILYGETLTIDCRPGKKSVVSSMFGNRPNAILANSDLGSFALHPGDNIITIMLYGITNANSLAYILWDDAYRGMD